MFPDSRNPVPLAGGSRASVLSQMRNLTDRKLTRPRTDFKDHTNRQTLTRFPSRSSRIHLPMAAVDVNGPGNASRRCLLALDVGDA